MNREILDLGDNVRSIVRDIPKEPVDMKIRDKIDANLMLSISMKTWNQVGHQIIDFVGKHVFYQLFPSHWRNFK
jgi:hypothetical protein